MEISGKDRVGFSSLPAWTKNKKRNKYRHVGKVNRILKGEVDQSVNLTHYKFGTGIDQEVLTNLTDSGYTLLSSEEIKKRENEFDSESSALIDSLN